MPTLKAPNKIVFLVSLILVIVAWGSALVHIPYIGEHPTILVILAFVVLAFGCSRAVTAASQALLTHAAAVTAASQALLTHAAAVTAASQALLTHAAAATGAGTQKPCAVLSVGNRGADPCMPLQTPLVAAQVVSGARAQIQCGCNNFVSRWRARRSFVLVGSAPGQYRKQKLIERYGADMRADHPVMSG